MATLSAIRDAIKTTLETVDGLRVHDTIPDGLNPPAVIVAPAEADFNVAFARGFDTWNFDLIVLVSRVNERTGQDSLDGYVNGFGSTSIRQKVFQSRDLGIGVDAHVSGMSRYGATWNIGGTDFYGASLRLVVRTSGTE